MATVPLYDLQKKKKGTVELSDEVFGAEVNEGLIYEVLKAQLASRRSGDAKVKGRSEVRGSMKKLYKQKGTGNARHGNKRAPIFAGGGKAHGPVPRSYAYRPPRKMRLGALRGALSLRAKQGSLIVIDSLELSEIKTKAVVQVLDRFDAPNALIVDDKSNDKLRLSLRNLPEHMFLPPEGVNLHDILRHGHLVVSRGAVDVLARRLGGAEGSG